MHECGRMCTNTIWDGEAACLIPGIIAGHSASSSKLTMVFQEEIDIINIINIVIDMDVVHQ